MVADISNLILDFNNINKNGYVPFKSISDHPIIVSLINDASCKDQIWLEPQNRNGSRPTKPEQ